MMLGHPDSRAHLSSLRRSAWNESYPGSWTWTTIGQTSDRPHLARPFSFGWAPTPVPRDPQPKTVGHASCMSLAWHVMGPRQRPGDPRSCVSPSPSSQSKAPCRRDRECRVPAPTDPPQARTMLHSHKAATTNGVQYYSVGWGNYSLSLRPINIEISFFRGQISRGMKLRMYPSFILHQAQHSSYLQCSLKLPDTAGGRKSA
jgi:hypothetical protein